MERCVQAAIDRLFEDLRDLGVRDTRRPPNSGRRRAFRNGWHDYIAMGRMYDPRIMRSKLSWQNLGRRLAEAVQHCRRADVDEVFDYLANGYEEGSLFVADRPVWERQSKEDDLLRRYWEQRGGNIFAVVAVGGSKGDQPWHGEASIRRIDGVRIPTTGRGGIFISDENAIAHAIRARVEIDVIEVKLNLNRFVIGQAIVGDILFQEKYGARSRNIRKVVVCRKTDAALEWACEEKLGITVWLPRVGG